MAFTYFKKSGVNLINCDSFLLHQMSVFLLSEQQASQGLAVWILHSQVNLHCASRGNMEKQPLGYISFTRHSKEAPNFLLSRVNQIHFLYNLSHIFTLVSTQPFLSEIPWRRVISSLITHDYIFMWFFHIILLLK